MIPAQAVIVMLRCKKINSFFEGVALWIKTKEKPEKGSGCNNLLLTGGSALSTNTPQWHANHASSIAARFIMSCRAAIKNAPLSGPPRIMKTILAGYGAIMKNSVLFFMPIV